MRFQIFVAVAALTAPLFGQQPELLPAFEVASVRVDQGAGPPVGLSLTPRRTGGRLTWTTTLFMLAQYAHNLPGWRISGIKSEPIFYTISATMDPAVNEAEVRRMFQGLLIERFGLVAHKESRELSGYALVVAKNGPKLAVATELGEAPPMPEYFKGKSPEAFEGRIVSSVEGPGTTAITGRGVPVGKLADEISAGLGEFVKDETGLNGKYYFGFKFLRDDFLADGKVEGVSLFTALQDELGLRLERQKGIVEMLVADKIEKVPTEN